MPKKSVREMKPFELNHYSLSGRMFRLVIILVAVIGIAAATFGFYLYNNSVMREFRRQSWNISRTVRYYIMQNDVQSVGRKVLDIYESIDPSDDVKSNNTYLAQFASVKDDKFESYKSSMLNIAEGNGAYAIYYGAIDKYTNRSVYLLDSDKHEGTYREPGYFDLIRTDTEIDEFYAYVHGSVPTKTDVALGLDESIPAYISNDPEYGYMCTGASVVNDDDRYIYMAFVDLDMNKVIHGNRIFMMQYLALLALTTLLVAFLITRRLDKTVIKPINQLTEAADGYSKDRQNNQFGTTHFDKLDIRTGDEIENLSLTMKDMEADIGEYIQDLTKATAEKQRINTELDVAREIQSGMIPHTFPAFPDRLEFGMYASMEPAREVGGDFYDYFLIDDNHLALMIADVTGKGVPAALFMMSSKTMLETTALKGSLSPAAILKQVNDEICKNNPTNMFVTVWLGILEISTGIMTCANGGHEYPAIRRGGGAFEIFKDPHGTMLGCFEDSEFTDYEINLEPGDTIFQYTDGATDTVNNDEEFFGMDRLVEALNKVPDNSPQEIINEIRYSLDEFADGAPRFDDLTMICLQYFEAKEFRALFYQDEMTVEADYKNWEKVRNVIEKNLSKTDCTLRDFNKIIISAEEIFTNICKFAYTPETGKVTVRISIYKHPMTAYISLIDGGVPFNPLDKPDPDVTLPAEDRIIGGLGIFLVKKLMDNVTYRRIGDMNELTLEKRIN